MVTKSQILRELGQRIDRAKDRGDWRSAELHAATALSVISAPNLAVSGLARRIAATDARVSLTEREYKGDFETLRREGVNPDGRRMI